MAGWGKGGNVTAILLLLLFFLNPGTSFPGCKKLSIIIIINIIIVIFFIIMVIYTMQICLEATNVLAATKLSIV